MLIKGACSHTEHDCSAFLLVDISQAKNGEFLTVVYFTRLRRNHIPCFPHDYICTFLIYFNNRNTSFVSKFAPFPELTDILLRNITR